jgi:hypothetical protein
MRDRDHRGNIEKRRQAPLEADRGAIHVAIGDAGDLVDLGVLEPFRTGRSEREHQVGMLPGARECRKGRCRCGCCFDRSYACDKRRDALAQVRPVLVLGGHDDKDGEAADPRQMQRRIVDDHR